MNKYILLLSLIIPTSSYAMKVRSEKAQADAQVLALPYGNQKVEIQLLPALRHILSYQKVVDPRSDETKISGLHAYSPQTVRAYQTGRVLEINDGLWIYTEDDHLDFHSGSIIYHGKAYDQHKTFFPCNYSPEQILSYIQQAQNAEIVWKENSDGPLQIVEASAKCAQSRLTFLFRSYNKQLTFKTLYPECDPKPLKRSVLDSLEQEQRERLKNAREERLAALFAAAKSGSAEAKETESAELIKAVKANEREKLLALLKAGADINEKDRQGMTPLMIAVQHSNYQIINDLIDQGARTDIKDKKGRTVFDYALHSLSEWCLLAFLSPLDSGMLNASNQEGFTPLISVIRRFSEQDLPEEKLFSAVECVDILLSFGADPQKADKDGFTPLMHCARVMHPSKPAQQALSMIMALLLGAGADCDVQRIFEGKRTGTALMYAAERNHSFLVTQLLEAQADYTLTNEKKRTARVIAQNKGFQVLVQLIDSFILQKEGWMIEHSAHELIYAAYKNNPTRVRKLLALSAADINKLSMKKDSALYYAVEHHNLSMVHDLLNAGADPRLKCPFECTILQYAQSLKERKPPLSGEIEELLADKVEELDVPTKQLAEQREIRKRRAVEQFKSELKHGQVTGRTLDIIKTIDPCVIDGESPLVCSIKGCKPRAVAQLCKDKAFYKDGRADPVEVAYEQGDPEILRTVLKSECAREERLFTVLDHALRKKRYDVLDILKAVSNFYYSVFKKAIIEGKTETIEKLCTYDADLLTYEQAGVCLLEAITAGRHKISELIIHCYPHVTRYVDGKGMTALMHAAHQGMVDICRKLFQAGADSAVLDSQGRGAHSFISAKSGAGQELYALFKEYASTKDAIPRSAPAAMPQQANDTITQEDCPADWTPAMKAVFRENGAEIRKISRGDLNRAGPEGLTPLHIATIHGKKRVLSELINRKGIDLNAQDAQGRTALYHCVERNDEQGVMKLLEKKARVFVVDKDGKSLFSVIGNDAQGERIKESCKQVLLEEVGQDHTAASCEVLYDLLEHFQYKLDTWLTISATLVFRSTLATLIHVLTQSERWRNQLRKIFILDRSSPYISDIQNLFLNVAEGKINPIAMQFMRLAQSFLELDDQARVEILLQHGFMRDPHTLFGAIVSDRAKVVPVLIDKLRVDMGGWTAYDAITSVPGSFVQTTQRIRTMLSQPEFEWHCRLEKEPPTLTPLIWACFHRKREVVKLFIQKRSPELHRVIEPTNLPAWCFLVNSYYHRDKEIMSLLEAWADTEEQAKKEFDSLLERAGRRPYVPLICFLAARKDVNLNRVDQQGDTILLSLLKAQGSTRGKLRDTRLRETSDAMCLDLVKKLVERSGGRLDVNKPDKTGVTPFGYAVDKHMVSIAVHIASLPSFDGTSPQALKRSNITMPVLIRQWTPAEILLLMHKRPDAFPPRALMSLALDEGNSDFVRIILHSKLVSDNELIILLSILCASGSAPQIKRLLRLKEDIRVNGLVKRLGEDSIPLTPLMVASRAGHCDTVALLLKINGINIHVKNVHGHEARDLAKEAGQEEVVQLLDAFEKNGKPALFFYECQQAKSELCDGLLDLVNYAVEKLGVEKSWVIPSTIRDDILEFVDSLAYQSVSDLEELIQKLAQYKKELDQRRKFTCWFEVLKAPATFTSLLDCWLCAHLETKYPEVQAVARCHIARCYFEGKLFRPSTEKIGKYVVSLCTRFSPDKIDHPWKAYASFYMAIFCSLHPSPETRAKAHRYFGPLTTYEHVDFNPALQVAACYYVGVSFLLSHNNPQNAQAAFAAAESFLQKTLAAEDVPEFVKEDAQVKLKFLKEMREKKE